MAHIDLHLHLLPGVDDGSPDEATALEHAARMVADGVREATVTPHVGAPAIELDPLSIPDRTAQFQAALDREGLGLRLHPGGEIFPEAELTRAELDAIAHGPPGARWVLAEVPFDGVNDGFFAGLDAIRAHGFSVLIAHPERAAGVLDGGLELLLGELARGAAFQVNVCSLVGRHGARRRSRRSGSSAAVSPTSWPPTATQALASTRSRRAPRRRSRPEPRPCRRAG